jgi:heptosyltransferase-3
VRANSRPVLVLHPGALGDVLQAVPALRALRGLFPAERVAFAGQPRLGHLLRSTGVVDEALAFDGLGLEPLFADAPIPASVRDQVTRFARVVSWFGAEAHPFASRLRDLVGDVILARPVPNTSASVPVWRHLALTLTPWGARPPWNLAPIVVPHTWGEDGRRALARAGAHSGPTVLLAHPGAGAAWKRWPVERLAEALRRVALESACSVVLHQGPADAQAAAALERALGRPLPRLVEPSLDLLAGAAATADAYLGPDSGVSHLAAAVGAPAVIVYPPATAQTWAPWSPTAVSVTASAAGDDTDRVVALVIARLDSRSAPRASM